jgi:hypothetical protein
VRTLERLLPLLPEGEAKERMARGLEALKSGAPLGPPREREPPPEPVDPMPEILRRCQDEENVENRRQGLRDLYGVLQGRRSDAPGTVSIPEGIFRPVHEDLEPDAECRAWQMRLVGRIGAVGRPFFAKDAGFGLYDPDPDVRRLSAEALAEIGAPGGIVYLRAYFFLVRYGDEAAPSDESEFNAARLALVRLTGHVDVPGAGEAWLPKDQHEDARDDWTIWFRSEEGVKALRGAVADLERLREMFPERHLVELMFEPSFELAADAYRALRKRSEGPPEGREENPRMKKWWPRFPRMQDADVTPQSLGGLRSAVKQWWADARADRG